MPNNYGRVIAHVLTTEGKTGAAYSISGRTAGSKKRTFTHYPDEGRIYVDSLGKKTAWQEKFKDLVFYNCMRTRGNLLIVTNGAQTDAKQKDGKSQ